jgi:hypothetical protein
VRTVAKRIGRTVPPEFGGTVRAVWSKACAIAPDDGVRGVAPALITIIREDVPMTAASIALGLPATYGFATFGVSVGDRISCDGASLVVRPAASRATLEASLLGAARYDGFAPEQSGALDPALLKAVEKTARCHRAAMCARTALGAASSAASDALLERLALGAAEDDAAATERAALSLVGLGPGLTPSGDDALCGFMLGRRLAGRGATPVDAVVARVASSAGGLTSDVSAVQLDLAARGRFGEALLGVATALAAGASRPLSAAVVRCLGEGATSGADALLGLVAGVRAGQFSGQATLVPS